MVYKSIVYKVSITEAIDRATKLYDELLFGIPSGDLYIDDKAATPSALVVLAGKVKN